MGILKELCLTLAKNAIRRTIDTCHYARFFKVLFQSILHNESHLLEVFFGCLRGFVGTGFVILVGFRSFKHFSLINAQHSR